MCTCLCTCTHTLMKASFTLCCMHQDVCVRVCVRVRAPVCACIDEILACTPPPSLCLLWEAPWEHTTHTKVRMLVSSALPVLPWHEMYTVGDVATSLCWPSCSLLASPSARIRKILISPQDKSSNHDRSWRAGDREEGMLRDTSRMAVTATCLEPVGEKITS